MPGKIPWDVIGPAAAVVVLVLAIVFAFILKFQKQSRVTVSSPSPLPKPSDTLSKQTLCFNHESRISKNETGIEKVEEQLEKTQKLNREDHSKIFDKIDDMGTKIIQEIYKNKSR